MIYFNFLGWVYLRISLFSNAQHLSAFWKGFDIFLSCSVLFSVGKYSENLRVLKPNGDALFPAIDLCVGYPLWGLMFPTSLRVTSPCKGLNSFPTVLRVNKKKPLVYLQYDDSRTLRLLHETRVGRIQLPETWIILYIVRYSRSLNFCEDTKLNMVSFSSGNLFKISNTLQI